VKGEEGLGSVSVNGRLTEMRTVITRLTEAVVAGLHLKLDAAQQRVIRRPISLISQAIEWFGRGVALEGDPKRQREAAAAYLRAVSLDNTLAEAHYRLGLLYRRAGEASGSIDHLQTAVRLGGQQPHHLVALADGLAGAGRHVAAYVRLNQALETDPLCADAYALLGHLYLSQGRHREAEPVLRQATELDPRPVQPWCDLGNLLFVTGHLKEAAASYRSALQGDPGHVQAMNNLGMVYLEQGRFDEAEKQFTAAVAAAPNGAHGHHNMARLRSAQRRCAEAVPHARRACKLAANDARMWLTLGQTLARAGALPEAVPALQKAVVLDRTDLIARQARLQLERIRQAQPDLFRP